MSIKIVIDSASDISAAEAAAKGIELLPIEINFGSERYLDGVDITPAQFYKKLVTSADIPKTSQINEFTFGQKFAELTGQGYDVIAITLSSALSGTYSGAKAAAEKFNGKVFAVDSLNASIGERLLCDYALNLIERGMGAQEVAKELERVRGRIKFYALLDTLTYLKKGGRISSATAFAGQLLFIKPVVCVEGGEVVLAGKAIGGNKGEALLKVLAAKQKADTSMPFGAIYSGTDDGRIKSFIAKNKDIFDGEEVPVYVLGCTVGTHIGPGGIGIAFFGK